MPTKKTTTLEPTAETPSREAQLADLDERADRLNGHSVRPSEMCGVVAGGGPYSGKRCTFRQHQADEPHSWESAEAKNVATLTDESPVGQPTLPGTPEPEQNEYSVPTEASFGKAKLQPAPGLRAIGDRLIAEDESFEHLRGVEIRYAWRRRGGMQGGTPRFARIKRPSVWEEFFTGGAAIFLCDLSADHVREHRFTERQIEAAIHEQLCKTDVDPDDPDAYRLLGPDFSGSIRTLDVYGAWRSDLRELRAHVAKLPLEEAIDQADESEADDGYDESDE